MLVDFLRYDENSIVRHEKILLGPADTGTTYFQRSIEVGGWVGGCVCVCLCACVCVCVRLCVFTERENTNTVQCNYYHRRHLVAKSRPTLFCMTSWTAAHQAPLTTGFFRQEYWSVLPFFPPEDLPDPGIEPASSALAGEFLTTESPLWY